MLDLLPDLCDAHPDVVRLFPPIFRQFGGKRIFHGPVVTLRCPEDNSLVREAVAEPGQGRVLLIDGGGLARRALLGDMLAEKAVANGWSGIVVFGYVRDVATLATLDLGVQALGAVPMKTEKRGLGDRDVVVEIDGIRIQPGDYLYADDNGVLVAPHALPLP
ncbi:regulator of ribonuclease activity A [Ferrimonas balearica DSM 9799]|uniref:4-hydroxy-4-methyl-2-oxoglutarate aldolase n=1 Tax=Ferrimonas balearica (strain DSM 9799 / CCM 4581 / KCTC 23876 / PAT) TaxID=550540 RepID=E1SP59_FERBD|nr:putative 4-hydroxy-4-methyl-2-oxoglutarate aldolase [Ferrimonas balearica]ADN75684.1 regulator of ribonuclease activity A [Ferrimonas balearica DSM 9799]MBW3138583.1 putative 4-hydroxy-4-methyl-2-oxoglutarate aldolase [Ferrimonas balearica]MBW3163828.1 putative 4-hydroxy-4-methyl-2-oxoglutarate aldolase [Ferrimonas balearica]MBY5979352.1 putative 4-hydroxy-4-methyl-2-oxoglutarate aldolase [Ferrimonas balearica]MBY6105644.1 putative 4-hydroxy-4-methyl-2-oxoglutarate aldolase [Ferrimonas bale